MKEKDIEIKSERARSIVGRMPSFYTQYGIAIASIVLLALVLAFCNIKVPETLSFQIKRLEETNVSYVSVPANYNILEGLNTIMIIDSLTLEKCNYKISRIARHKGNIYIYFFPNQKKFPTERTCAILRVRRYTFIQCLNTQNKQYKR